MNIIDTIPYCPFSNAERGKFHEPSFAPCMLGECMAFEEDRNDTRNYSGIAYTKCRCLRIHRESDEGILMSDEVLYGSA